MFAFANVRLQKTNIVIGSMYLTGDPHSDWPNIDCVQRFIGMVACPWLIGGDWNGVIGLVVNYKPIPTN